MWVARESGFECAACIALVVVLAGCGSKRSRSGSDDWRREIPFTYPAEMDPRIVVPAQRTWGTHVHALAWVSPDESGAGVLVTMAAGRDCRRRPMHRFVLEAGQALVEHQLSRVVCRPGGGDGVEVAVVPYIEGVARALGYSFETWMQKGFEFQGAVTEPMYLKREFSDRFAFLAHTMQSRWEQEKQYGPGEPPALGTRRDKTVLVLTTPDCELVGWRDAWFENGQSRGADLIYYWVTGGGRFAVCEGPQNRYLLGMPQTLGRIGLDGVKAFWECVSEGPLDRKDIDFRCN